MITPGDTIILEPGMKCERFGPDENLLAIAREVQRQNAEILKQNDLLLRAFFQITAVVTMPARDFVTEPAA
jgi:hypothetical protein